MRRSRTGVLERLVVCGVCCLRKGRAKRPVLIRGQQMKGAVGWNVFENV
jgi:hypothetical protein